MHRSMLLAASAALVCGPLLAQRSRRDPRMPITAPVRKVAVRVDRGTGRAVRVPASIGNGSIEPLYANTCAAAYYAGLLSASATGGSQAQAVVDQGRVPDRLSSQSGFCAVGSADAYEINRFEIAYCTTTGAPVAYATALWDAAGLDCPNAFGSAAAFTLTVVGLPRSSASGAQACYLVTIDLGTPGFTLQGGSSDVAPERFAWAHQYPGTTGSDGPLLAGNPSFACPPCAGTLWEVPSPSTSPGTGLGAADSYWLEEFGGTGTGCVTFAGNPFASFYLQLQGQAGPLLPIFGPSGASASIFTAAELGGELYVGGQFETIGGVRAHGIARWNGASWSAVGSGIEGVSGGFHPYVSTLVVHAGALYVGGSFEAAGGATAHNVARWNGSTWSALGPGPAPGTDDAVLALAVFDDGGGAAVHAGGLFQTAGGVDVGHVARWNDGAGVWQALSSGGQAGTDGPVIAMRAGTVAGSSGAALYVGGLFDEAGGASCGNAARWDGSAWSSLGSAQATDGVVQALALWDDGGGLGLYLGGDFANAGGAPAARVARWRNGSFAALGSGVGSAAYENVRALVPFDAGGGTELFVFGALSRVGGIQALGPGGGLTPSSPSLVGRWDGTSWTAAGGALGGAAVAALSIDLGSGPRLHVAGEFTTVEGVRAMRVARYDALADAWAPVEASASGEGLSGPALAATSYDDGSGDDLYVGGEFGTAGSAVASNVARWDPPNGWVALGAGTDGRVLALVAGDVDGTDALYAGGEFASAGGAPAARIARWDGASWSALGAGTSGPVHALAIHDPGGGDQLFAAGAFLTAGGVAVDHVARWNGSTWAALQDGGPDGPVLALAVADFGGGPQLYAAGRFDSAGGVPTQNIARWDGASWSAVGSGLDGEVLALFVRAGQLYAGGSFVTGGSQRLGHLARWDGATWSPLGLGAGGTDGPVLAIGGTSAGDLWVGGRFALAGGMPAANIARWNGSWSSAPGGTNGDVAVLHARSGLMFAGGHFSIAANLPDSFLAVFPNP